MKFSVMVNCRSCLLQANTVFQKRNTRVCSRDIKTAFIVRRDSRNVEGVPVRKEEQELSSTLIIEVTADRTLLCAVGAAIRAEAVTRFENGLHQTIASIEELG